MLLGCIADDLTGATDLSLMLTKEGLRTVQCTGVPLGDLDLGHVDALVIALKSRSIPAAAAVASSLEAASALHALGAQRLLFKYCSTFDSTDDGNIGPVIEALLGLVGGDTIACPAFPRAGRTIYAGQLFVNGTLLSESPMKDHPLNPMSDSDLRRVLGRQTSLSVGLVGFEDVEAGPDGVRAALAREAEAGRRIAIVDALTDRHLRDIGAAAAHLRLITGGSGIAMGLPAAYLSLGLLDHLTPPPRVMSAPAGRAAILAGSCSAATRQQVATAVAAGLPTLQLDAERLAAGHQSIDDVLGWVDQQTGGRPDPHLFERRSRTRARDPVPPRARRGRPFDRDAAGRDGARAAAARLRPPSGRGRRDLRCRHAGARGAGAVDRPGDRPGRALDPHPRRTRHGPGAEVRQLRCTGLLPQGLGATLVSDAALRERICAVGASLFRRGLTFGSTGNISVRHPDGGWLMTPTNASMGELDPARLSRLDDAGALTGGDEPTKEAFLHRVMYAERSKAQAVVHLHATHSVAVSCLQGLDHRDCLPPLTAYYVMRVGRLPVVPYHPPGDESLALAVAKLAGRHHAVLLANHGPVVAGTSLDNAMYATEELEETARLFLLLRNQPVNPLTPAEVEDLRSRLKLW